MMNDKQTEIEEMAKDLDEIYNTDFKGDYESGLKDMASRLCAKGYRKSQDVAEEIFAEIEELMSKLDRRYMASGNPKQSWGVRGAISEIAELKKKYTESEKDDEI